MKTIEQIFEVDTGAKRIVPGLQIDDINLAVPTAEALLAAGIDVATIRVVDNKSFDVISRLSRDVPELTIGAGFVLKSSDFMSASVAGAKFISSPGSTPELFTAARTRFNSAHFLPGVVTPSEVIDAYTRGFNVLNLYPVEYFDGFSLLQHYGRIFPKISFAVHGGVLFSGMDLDKYLVLPNVVGVGVSSVETAALIASGDFLEIRRWGEQVVAIAKSAMAKTK